MRARLADFLRDQRGGASLLMAASIFVVFGFGAMAVDVGSFFYEKRRQQTATDLAALAAASDLPRAHAAAEASIRANGFSSGNVEAVEFGVYTPDPALPPAQRFRAGPASGANAVRIETRAVTQMLLGRVLAASGANLAGENAPRPRVIDASAAGGDVPIRSRAVAVQDAQAAFAVGSRLARLDGGVLNGVLGALLGGAVSLSVMDYEALARARIDLFDFSKALNARADLRVATYDEVLRSRVRLGDVLAAAHEAARDGSTSSIGANAALSRLASDRAAAADTVDLASLVAFGPYGERPLAEPKPLSASLSALDFVSAVAQVANGARQVDLALAVNIPGLAAVRLKLGVGERPVGASLVGVGRPGASVHTAQTRLLLTVDLVGSGQASLVRLPLYLELASATARLTQVQCSPGEVSTARVTLGVTPALVDAWIGQVSNADFANFRTAPNPPAAVLLNLAGLAKVSGRAHATMTNLAETPVTFTFPEIQRGDKRTTSTQNFVATLLSRLVGDLEVRVEALGLGLPLPGLGGAVGGVVAGAATPLDLLIQSVLGALGLGLGQADSWVSGVRCGGAVLVR